jgi:guanylate kinase
MNKKGLLVVLSGPSGSGKGTVLRELLNEEENIFLSVSATTRSPRPGEENGVHYFFLNREEFETEIQNDGMLEHASYCGNYYGTPKKPVFDRCDNGQDVILEIEVQGAMQVLEKYEEAVSIFIMPPSLTELRERLIGRQTEDMETVEKRLTTALEEMKYAGKYDYVVVNDSIKEAVQDIKAILRSEKLKSRRMADFLQTLADE